MKQWISIILCMTLLLCVCSACTPSSGDDPSVTTTTEGDNVVTTTVQGPTSTTSSGEQIQTTTTTTRAAVTTTTVAPTTKLSVKEMKAMVKERADALGLTNTILKRSIVSEGNRVRLARVMKKALKGETVTLGVVGGSITEGASSSNANFSYAGQFKAWWEKMFPMCTVKLVNIGKGSTPSMIGVHCADEQLLVHKPDVVIMEYAVNDGDDPLHHNSYESLIRKLWLADSKPAVMLMFTMYEDSSNRQRPQSKIGKHYSLPMISYRDAMYPEVESGKIKWSDIGADGVHPNDNGHAIMGTLIANYLVSVYEDLNDISTKEPALPEPLVGDDFVGARLYTPKNFKPTKQGNWQHVNNAFYQFPDAWKVTGGDLTAIEFTIPNCTRLYLLTLRLDDKNAGIANVTVKGETNATLQVGLNFPGMGHIADPHNRIYEGTKPTDVTVTIQLDPNTATASTYFTILGLLVS